MAETKEQRLAASGRRRLKGFGRQLGLPARVSPRPAAVPVRRGSDIVGPHSGQAAVYRQALDDQPGAALGPRPYPVVAPMDREEPVRSVTAENGLDRMIAVRVPRRRASLSIARRGFLLPGNSELEPLFKAYADSSRPKRCDLVVDRVEGAKCETIAL